ncbi:hypothetical protein HII12_003230 [Brettanomyces bruxellensis]|uniref:SEC14 homolog 3 n=1 Tax=Dekkera bruxellensis TaxID=5007 RepID=A0A3F2Y510_DEKBR|nr:hypothetical protein HII12_003230 [Brettanomyces bruxellensis]VUG17824.1 PDR16 [Brettanomyces bruxellensis]
MFGLTKKNSKDSEKASVESDEKLIHQEVPFEHPPERIHAPAEKPLTSKQNIMYQNVLRYFQNPELVIRVKEKGNSSTEKTPLSLDEKAWITRECILRYLRATKWIEKDAIDRIEGTIAWRREFGIDHIEDSSKNKVTPELVEPECLTGKQVVLGFDNDSRPCLYLKPGRQNTKNSFRQVQHLVFFLERVIDFMPSGQDSLALLIDFKQHPEIAAEVETSKIPTLSISRQVLHILQTHYPERLGKALLTNIPFLGRTFLRLIYPFIDPLTRQKLEFDADFSTFCPREQLDKEFNGSVDFEYNHKVYYPALIKTCRKNRERYMERFKKFGSVVGLSEIDLRGNSDDLQVPVGSHPWEKKGANISLSQITSTQSRIASSTKDQIIQNITSDSEHVVMVQ